MTILAWVVAVGAGIIGGAVNAQDPNSLIMQLCKAGFAAAFETAGKLPPPGMADFTCICFHNEVIVKGQSIADAKDHCIKLAEQRFAIR